jgi:hypothetical protein
MTQEDSLNRILELERSILRALCCGSRLDPEMRDDAMRNLHGYAWRDEEHRVVCAALVRIQRSSGASVAEQLPAQATRMGFPDVDWKLYLHPRPTEGSELDIRFLVGELKSATDTALL